MMDWDLDCDSVVESTSTYPSFGPQHNEYPCLIWNYIPSNPLYYRKRMDVHRNELIRKVFHPNRLHYAGVKIHINFRTL